MRAVKFGAIGVGNICALHSEPYWPSIWCQELAILAQLWPVIFRSVGKEEVVEATVWRLVMVMPPAGATGGRWPDKKKKAILLYTVQNR